MKQIKLILLSVIFILLLLFLPTPFAGSPENQQISTVKLYNDTEILSIINNLSKQLDDYRMRLDIYKNQTCNISLQELVKVLNDSRNIIINLSQTVNNIKQEFYIVYAIVISVSLIIDVGIGLYLLKIKNELSNMLMELKFHLKEIKEKNKEQNKNEGKNKRNN